MGKDRSFIYLFLHLIQSLVSLWLIANEKIYSPDAYLLIHSLRAPNVIGAKVNCMHPVYKILLFECTCYDVAVFAVLHRNKVV